MKDFREDGALPSKTNAHFNAYLKEMGTQRSLFNSPEEGINS